MRSSSADWIFILANLGVWARNWREITRRPMHDLTCAGIVARSPSGHPSGPPSWRSFRDGPRPTTAPQGTGQRTIRLGLSTQRLIRTGNGKSSYFNAGSPRPARGSCAAAQPFHSVMRVGQPPYLTLPDCFATPSSAVYLAVHRLHDLLLNSPFFLLPSVGKIFGFSFPTLPVIRLQPVTLNSFICLIHIHFSQPAW
jgi:hypothetical protein